MKSEKEIFDFCATWFNWNTEQLNEVIVFYDPIGAIEFALSYLPGNFILALMDFVQAKVWAITINSGSENISLSWRIYADK